MPRRVAIVALLAVGCRSADLVVVDVRELGPIPEPPEMQGRDGGVSGLFQGRSVWVYGDGVATEAGTYPNTWRNNSMSWTTDLDASDGLDGLVQPVDAQGAAAEFFPRTAAEQAFNEAHLDDGDCEEPCGARYAIWGGGPVADGDRAWLSYAQVRADPGPWNFHLVGASLAVWEEFDAAPVRPEVEADLDDPTLLFDCATEGEWGPGLHVDGDHLGMYSCSGGPWNDHSCRVGRAPIDRALRRDAWEFWDGRAWTPEVRDAKALFAGSPNISFHYSAHLDRWLAVYLAWGGIVARTAPAPEGPWSASVAIYTPPQDDAMHAGAHAELSRVDGAVEYVSYLADEFYLIEVTLTPR